jgi:hypothetical protein
MRIDTDLRIKKYFTTKPAAEDSFSSIPNELLTQIFGHLPTEGNRKVFRYQLE